MDLPSAVHRALIRTQKLQDYRGLGRLWRKAYAMSRARWGNRLVSTRLHGHEAVINFANPYPNSVRRFPNYNAPQVELVSLSAEVLGRPVHVIDVGAAVGDTALLLLQRCGKDIARLDCVEAENDFAKILRRNLAGTVAQVHHVMLSDGAGTVSALVRDHHQGTATAAGPERVIATTLDAVFAAESPDVIKIDTDGFDGRILAGAAQTLRRARPSVLFEWAPPWYCRINNDPEQPFQVLTAAGYDKFVFFTKFGQFSHFGCAELEHLTELCLHSETLDDWHYDVAALHADSKVDPVLLADLRHWGSSGWRY